MRGRCPLEVGDRHLIGLHAGDAPNPLTGHQSIFISSPPVSGPGTGISMQSMHNDRPRTFSDNFSQWQPASLGRASRRPRLRAPPPSSSLFPMLHLYPHTQDQRVLFAARHTKYKNSTYRPIQKREAVCVNGPGTSQCSRLTLTGASGNPTGADKKIHHKQCVKPPHACGFCRDRISHKLSRPPDRDAQQKLSAVADAQAPGLPRCGFCKQEEHTIDRTSQFRCQHCC